MTVHARIDTQGVPRKNAAFIYLGDVFDHRLVRNIECGHLFPRASAMMAIENVYEDKRRDKSQCSIQEVSFDCGFKDPMPAVVLHWLNFASIAGTYGV